MLRIEWAAWASTLLAVSMALGDQIIFKNGDRLTGTVKSADGGKIVIETPMAGTVTADLANVSTFTTDQPIALQLQDGKQVRRKVVATTQGMVMAEGEPIPILGIR